MKESFLHYVWNYKLFDLLNLETEHGERVEILQSGLHNKNAGPDFIEAELIIGNEHWVGSIEMHLRSTDWDSHNHSRDKNYMNVILHVVWEHNKEVIVLRERNVQTLVLQKYVQKHTLSRYKQLLKYSSKIPCHSFVEKVNWEKITFWFQRLIVERMQEKLLPIEQLAHKTNYHWEEILFKLLAKSFGLKVNSDAFEHWAASFPFAIFQKIQHSNQAVESLFFGQAGFLFESTTDSYQMMLHNNYQFLKRKYNLIPLDQSIFKFSKMRPSGFPTIRIAQLAAIYSNSPSLFQTFMKTKTINEYEKYFKKISLPSYWLTHYRFNQYSKSITKKITTDKIQNLLINTIYPLQFYYNNYYHRVDIDLLISQFEQMKAEKNVVLREMQAYGFSNNNALESQVLLHLKKTYCDQKKCLNCAIGNQILKTNE